MLPAFPIFTMSAKFCQHRIYPICLGHRHDQTLAPFLWEHSLPRRNDREPKEIRVEVKVMLLGNQWITENQEPIQMWRKPTKLVKWGLSAIVAQASVAGSWGYSQNLPMTYGNPQSSPMVGTSSPPVPYGYRRIDTPYGPVVMPANSLPTTLSPVVQGWTGPAGMVGGRPVDNPAMAGAPSMMMAQRFGGGPMLVPIQAQNPPMGQLGIPANSTAQQGLPTPPPQPGAPGLPATNLPVLPTAPAPKAAPNFSAPVAPNQVVPTQIPTQTTFTPAAPLYVQPSIPQPMFATNDNYSFDDGTRGYTTISAGVDLLILKPYFEDNVAFRQGIMEFDPNPPNPFPLRMGALENKEFDWDPSFSPRFWLAFSTPSGTGFRARWFAFDHRSKSADVVANLDPAVDVAGSVNVFMTPNVDFFPAALTTFLSALSPLVPNSVIAALGAFSDTSADFVLAPSLGQFAGLILGPGVGVAGPDRLNFSSNMILDTIDLELTQQATLGEWDLVLIGGARYLHMSQNYKAIAQNTSPFMVLGVPVNLTETRQVHIGHNFNGLGPVLGVEARRALGDSGFSVYGNFRGAAVFGRSKKESRIHMNVDLSVPIVGLNVPVALDRSARDSRDDLLPITELELGVEYGVETNLGRLFVQGAFVQQVYFGLGNSSSEDGNTGLMGGTINAGLNY